MKPNNSTIRLVLFFCFFFFGNAAANDLHKPTIVHVEYLIQSIYGIDTINQAFQADFYLYVHWRHPDGEQCTPSTNWNETWNPGIEFVNSVNELNPRKSGYECYRPDETGRSDFFSFWGRYQGTFQSSMNFERFPLDRHQLSIDIESYQHNSTVLIFGYDGKTLDDNGALLLCTNADNCLDKKLLLDPPPLSEWSLGNISVKQSLTDYSATEGSGITYSNISLEIEINRLYQHYLWKILLPVALQLLLSLLILTANPQDFIGRFGATVTLFLSMLALSFATQDMLPPVPYIVLADAFILAAYIMIFLSSLESAVTYWITRKGESSTLSTLRDLPRKIDKTCLALFPLLYIIFGIYAFNSIGR